MGAIESVSNKIFTPDATSLTDTPDAQNQADSANKVPTADPAGKQFEVPRPIEGAELAAHQVGWDDSGVGGIDGLWKFTDSVKNFFTSKYGTNPGLNPNFRAPEGVNKTWIA